MGEHTAISWTDHTFNPWWGCTKVSPGCDNCYAETFTKRFGLKVWGQDAPPKFFSDKHWAEPLKWNRDAEKAGVRRRVFCASMADVFEGRPEHQPHRLRLWRLIMETPHLDWLLLTKRPGAIVPLLRTDASTLLNAGTIDSGAVDAGAMIFDWVNNGYPPANVWLGTTVEDQARARRIDDLVNVPARVRFISAEPLLARVRLDLLHGECGLCADNTHDHECPVGRPRVDWVIVGGESGPGARPFDIAWARDIVGQCKRAGVACFVKQLGARPQMTTALSRSSSGTTKDGSKFSFKVVEASFEGDLYLRDRKGGDMSEWPADLRVREFPEVRHG